MKPMSNYKQVLRRPNTKRTEEIKTKEGTQCGDGIMERLEA